MNVDRDDSRTRPPVIREQSRRAAAVLGKAVGTARGFTLIEMGVAMAMLAAAMLLVMQIGLWSLRHRSRTAARFAALELANNVLEQARAIPWDSLTDEWAKAPAVPDEFAEQLADGTLAVQVELTEPDPLTKRVAVEVRWLSAVDDESHSVRLQGLFSRRTALAESQ